MSSVCEVPIAAIVKESESQEESELEASSVVHEASSVLVATNMRDMFFRVFIIFDYCVRFIQDKKDW